MIPIFIISSDRLKFLKESIQSYYDCIKTPFEIVIIDFGTSYEPTREFLRHLEYEGKTVYWNDKISYKGSLNLIRPIVQDYFKTHPASNYVVTDPDIALDNVEGDVLEVYAYLLKRFHKISVAGPMLRIDDIPDHYLLKEKLLFNSLESTYLSRKKFTTQYKDKAINFKLIKIDTTFGMRRAGEDFWRCRWGARVFAPYSAKHLEWYLDFENLTEDQEYYMQHASRRISTWGRCAINVVRRSRRLKCQ